MTKEDLDSVLRILPTLSSEERGKVEMTAKFLGSRESVVLEESADELELCYESMRTTLKWSGLNCPPWNVFTRLGIYRHYQKGYLGIESYLAEYFPNAKRTDRQKLYRVFAELILVRMKRDHLDPKLGIFVQRLNQIPELMIAAFPGYAEQGWLELILTWGDRDART